jgi:hypothetical protein
MTIKLLKYNYAMFRTTYTLALQDQWDRKDQQEARYTVKKGKYEYSCFSSYDLQRIPSKFPNL